jgi:hypothetical protein
MRYINEPGGVVVENSHGELVGWWYRDRGDYVPSVADPADQSGRRLPKVKTEAEAKVSIIRAHWDIDGMIRVNDLTGEDVVALYKVLKERQPVNDDLGSTLQRGGVLDER